jgi:hypothetical protein
MTFFLKKNTENCPLKKIEIESMEWEKIDIRIRKSIWSENILRKLKEKN